MTQYSGVDIWYLVVTQYSGMDLLIPHYDAVFWYGPSDISLWRAILAWISLVSRDAVAVWLPDVSVRRIILILISDAVLLYGPLMTPYDAVLLYGLLDISLWRRVLI
jgi:hypothetical protein